MGLRQRISAQFLSGHTSPVIVIGMHRSGTSLLTRLLCNAGINMGNSLSSNAESQFFQRLNKKILDPIGVSWRSLDYLPAQDQIRNIYAETISDRVAQTVNSRLVPSHISYQTWIESLTNRSIHWGWKDPRTTLVLPIWKRVFPKAKIVHIYRDGRDCAVSLLQREFREYFDIEFDITKTVHQERLRCDFKLWERYVDRAFDGAKDFENSQAVKFEELVRSPEKVVRALLHDLKMDRHDLEFASRMVNPNILNKRYNNNYREARRLITHSKWLNKLGYSI